MLPAACCCSCCSCRSLLFSVVPVAPGFPSRFFPAVPSSSACPLVRSSARPAPPSAAFPARPPALRPGARPLRFLTARFPDRSRFGRASAAVPKAMRQLARTFAITCRLVAKVKYSFGHAVCSSHMDSDRPRTGQLQRGGRRLRWISLRGGSANEWKRKASEKHRPHAPRGRRRRWKITGRITAPRRCAIPDTGSAAHPMTGGGAQRTQGAREDPSRTSHPS